MFKKLGLMAATTASVFAMHNAEININDKDLEIAAKLDMGQFNQTIEPGTTFVGATYLNGSDDHTANKEHNNSNVNANAYLELNFLMKREIPNSKITLGIGVKANYTKMEAKFASIPLGLELGYTIPSTMPVTVGASVYYAPESLAMLDADSFLEYGLEANVELIERAYLVAGYRNLETSFKVDANVYKINYNSSAYFGFRFDF